MRFFYTIITLTFLNIFLGNAQTADLRITPIVNCATKKLEAIVQIKSQAGTSKIGTSSILLNYNRSSISFSSYQSETFDKNDLCIANAAASWDEHVFDGFTAGTFNLTMTLLNNDFSCPEINTTWINVGKITFDVILLESNPQLEFDIANTNFNSVPANDGSSPILKGAFTGYSPASMACPNTCTINAGADQEVCSPVSIASLNAATGTDQWSAMANNPSAATIGSTDGRVSGLTALGIYKFILSNPTTSCADTVAIVVKNCGCVKPIISTTNPAAVCTPNAINLINSVTGCTGTLTFFTDSIGTNPLTGSTATSSGTYYAKCTVLGCDSDLMPIVATIGSAPAAPNLTGGGAICAGQTVTLTTSVCTGTIKWYNGDFLIAGQTGTTYSASTAGSYTATCTNACGESAKSNIANVTTGAAPAAPTVSGGGPICANEAAVINLTNCNGTIKWYSGNDVIAGQTGSLYSTTVAGSYTATCTNACGESVKSTVAIVTTGVAPAAPLLAGGGTICPGQTVTLTASGCSGINKWYKDNVAIAGATSATYVATAVGNYTVTCTNACGDSPASNVVAVVNSSAPAAPIISTSSTTICNGSTATLSSTCAGGSILKWSTGATTATITTNTAGTYSAICMNECGNSPASNSITITTNAPATPSSVSRTNACPATTVNLSDLITASSELYTDAARATSPLSAAAVSAVSSTQTYYLFNKSASGCYSASATVSATITVCQQPASIGNFVWNDLNQNGIQNDGEPGIAGVKVYLVNLATSSSTSVLTNANGKFSFTDLIPGNYSLIFNTPAGYVLTNQNAGSDATKDSDAEALLGATNITNLASAENDSTWDAGFYIPIPKGSIGNFVFNDVNNNGTQDAGDTPVSGLKVYLLNSTGLKIDSTFSNLDGSYVLNAPAGTYTVQFTAPAGRVFTTSKTGDATKDSDAAANGQTASITIDTTKPVGDAARNITDIDAGLKVTETCVPTCMPITFIRK